MNRDEGILDEDTRSCPRNIRTYAQRSLGNGKGITRPDRVSSPVKEPLTLDVETCDDTLLVVGLGDTAYRPDDAPWDVIADPDQAHICHTSYDFTWLRRHGYTVRGDLHDTRTFAWYWSENTPLDLDFLCKHYLGTDPDKRLKSVCSVMQFTRDDGTRTPLTNFAQGMAREDEWAQLLSYCARDLVHTTALYERLRELLAKLNLGNESGLDKILKWEIPFASVLVDLECAGMPINLGDTKALGVELAALRAKQSSKCLAQLGYAINLESNPALSDVLYKKVWVQRESIPIDKTTRDCLKGNCAPDEHGQCIHVLPMTFDIGKVGRAYVHGTITRKGLGLKRPKRTKTATATDSKTLRRWHGAHPWVKDLLEYRQTSKVLSYLDAYLEEQKDGRLYSRWNRTGTTTGRLSCAGVNLQQVARRSELGAKVRGLFQGNFIIGDMSQLEPRISASMSGDPYLTKIFTEGRDLYCEVGANIYGKAVEKGTPERDQAKVIVLSTAYGAMADNLAGQLTISGYPTTNDRAQEYLDDLDRMFSRLTEWRQEVVDFARDRGYVKTLGGRVRRIHFEARRGWKTGFDRADRQAYNSVIQGSASDVLHRVMLRTREMHSLRLLAQVHDELVWQHLAGVWGNQALLGQLQLQCENPGLPLRVPLSFSPSFCTSWDQK